VIRSQPNLQDLVSGAADPQHLGDALVIVLMAVVLLLGLHILLGALSGIVRGRERLRAVRGWLFLGGGLAAAAFAEFVGPDAIAVAVRVAGILTASIGMVMQRRSGGPGTRRNRD
jgi:hypothetical protein